MRTNKEKSRKRGHHNKSRGNKNKRKCNRASVPGQRVDGNFCFSVFSYFHCSYSPSPSFIVHTLSNVIYKKRMEKRIGEKRIDDTRGRTGTEGRKMERKFSYFLLNLQYTIVFHSFVLLITPEKIYIYRGIYVTSIPLRIKETEEEEEDREKSWPPRSGAFLALDFQFSFFYDFIFYLFLFIEDCFAPSFSTLLTNTRVGETNKSKTMIYCSDRIHSRSVDRSNCVCVAWAI